MADDLTQFTERYRYPGWEPWVMPAYGGESAVNLVNSLLALFGAPAGPPLAFHQQFVEAIGGRRKILLLLLDGFGWHNMRRAHDRCAVIRDVFATARQWPLTTVFPSTTSAALTSTLYGVPPAEHGVIGYLEYFPEYGRVFNMLGFRTPDILREDLLDFGFKPETFVNRPTLLDRVREAGALAGAYSYQAYTSSGLSRLIYPTTPPFPYYALGDMLSMALEQLRMPSPHFLFLYWSTLDTIAHNYGAGSEAYAIELAMLAMTIRDLVLPWLDDDTAFLVTADHGHIDGNDAESMNLMDHPSLVHALRAPPAGEGRAAHLFIKPGEIHNTRDHLAEMGGMTVLTRDAFLDLGLLGNPPLRDGLAARIGDLVVLPHDSRRVLYEYQPRPHTAMVGRHGGLSPDEMVIPLLIWS